MGNPVNKIICRNAECSASAQRHLDPPALRVVREHADAWVLECPVCAKEGRISMRVATKDQVGGTFGAGWKSDGVGPLKGPSKYRPGVTFPVE